MITSSGNSVIRLVAVLSLLPSNRITHDNKLAFGSPPKFIKDPIEKQHAFTRNTVEI